ncbi:chromate efflux transporter [Pseudochrobactrum lubricantis]|uniref:chromate efflux transporter n=1 Tax=Pseudochrobactrum lubricantis TaxID=558172 RepID=UPI0035D9249A
MSITTSKNTAAVENAVPSFAEATRVWAKIGMLSFGGPAGQIALMHKELVEDRGWISEQRFLHALNYCMLLPGPEAQQLATYIGWLMHRTKGGLIAGMLFVLPGALVMLGLSILYVFYRHTPFIDAAFFGVKAAVLAVVVEAVLRIGKRALKNRIMVSMAFAAFIGIYVFHIPFPIIIILAGMSGWIGNQIAPKLFTGEGHAGKRTVAGFDGIIDRMFDRGELTHTEPSMKNTIYTLLVWLPVWLSPVLFLWLISEGSSIWAQIGTFFSGMAIVTFGGAYAVLSYVAQAAVDTFSWLTAGEMVDGLGLAETTPGPLIMVLQFVGFLAAYRTPGLLDPLLAGCLGALLTTWVTFAPSFLFIFVGAPYSEALRGNKIASAILTAITAAVVGVILNLALWFALHVIFREVRSLDLWGVRPDVPILSSIDWTAAAFTLATMIAMFRFKAGMLMTLAVSAIAGLALRAVEGSF